MKETKDESIQVVDSADLKSMIDKINESITAQQAQLEAIKELTKTCGELVAGWEKWRKAGKF